MRSWLTLGTVVAAALLLAPSSAAGQTLRAGAAAADITPPIGTPMFAYTARHVVAGGQVDRPMQIVADPDQNLYAKSFVPSKGIHQRLKARSIVLEQDGRKYALVQADLGGVPYALLNEVAKRVASTGITEERILLSATHTHTGTGPIWPADNAGYAALGGDLFDPRIFDLTAQGIAEAILEADGRLQDARLGVGTVQLRGASRNRAFDEFRVNPDVPQDEAAARADSIDPNLSVVRVDDRRGRPIGVWSNFALHATSFDEVDLLFSGDNPGIAEELVETELRERAGGREVVNVWTNGSEGDISPDGDPDRIGGEPAQNVTNGFGGAYMAGSRVAGGVLSAWRAAGASMTSQPRLGAEMTYMNFDGTPAEGKPNEPVGPTAVLGAGLVSERQCAPFEFMSGPGQGWKLGLNTVGLVPNIHPVSMWNVGGLGVVGLPSEVTKQMGERIREGLEAAAGGRYQRVALAGLTGSYMSYTSTPEEFDECHYEASFTLFGRQQGPRFLDVAKQLSQAVLAGEDAPAGIAPPGVGIGTTAAVPPRRTPGAGTALEEPADSVQRLGRATFRWQGGDPSVDAPRGATFTEVQRRAGSRWESYVTDASFRNTTERSAGDKYAETMQFAECDPLATYRVLVRGRADKGNGVVPYTVASEPFTLAPVTLTPRTPVVEGGRASVKATYPSPGGEALIATPRLVRSGVAVFRVGKKKLRTAPFDAATATASIPVEDGQSVELVRVVDGCGNSSD